MSPVIPTIEFFKGIAEELSSVSLRLNRATGVKTVLVVFDSLKALEKFNSFTKGAVSNLSLQDSEGEILINPSSFKIIFGGDEGNELRRVECRFEPGSNSHWERFSRFMERYAAANQMEFGTGRPVN